MRWPNEKLGKIVGSGNRIKLRSYNVNFKRAVRNLKPSHVVSVENHHFLFYTFEVCGQKEDSIRVKVSFPTSNMAKGVFWGKPARSHRRGITSTNKRYEKSKLIRKLYKRIHGLELMTVISIQIIMPYLNMLSLSPKLRIKDPALKIEDYFIEGAGHLEPFRRNDSGCHWQLFKSQTSPIWYDLSRTKVELSIYQFFWMFNEEIVAPVTTCLTKAT